MLQSKTVYFYVLLSMVPLSSTLQTQGGREVIKRPRQTEKVYRGQTDRKRKKKPDWWEGLKEKIQ